MRVVGVDLRSSARYRTGVAVLDSDLRATTALLRTDAEIVQWVTAYTPAVVAIDSPLNLPRGRCCADESCSCAVHGIVRAVDREIARMGHHPYWPLMPSMVKLTLRGMALKQTLEEAGLCVIEVFPGAAQDVLGVPRKQAGQELLLHGLRAVGIRFDPQRERFAHDELDAVTAAYVGLLYLRGDYEAVGPEDEVQMVLPRRA